ncbi:DMT family transporter [Hoeflea poritis]|uniref:DMT family transporter n=1 Tax=Hoeflea poritis TaxID=2993659 RepID=A0ABT4VPX4_9HYPH|nr:DMT family transporter [Hoeflea poritis]MDA4846068.1 DMT family transporter [Hoeflea poritis]
MSEVARHSYGLHPRAAEGITCIVLGMMFFVVQDGLMKTLIGAYPIWILMGVRGLISLLILLPMIVILGQPHRLFTPVWPLHLLRAFMFALGFSLFYTAFPFMSLAEVSTIFFSAPLMIALLAALFLGEQVGIHRISALIFGFVGVVIAMNPQVDSFRWATLLPLACAFCYAVSQILARQIGDRDSTLTTGLYTVVLSSIMLLAFGWAVNRLVDFGPELNHLRWQIPAFTAGNLVMFALLGTVGMVGYLLISRAYQVTSASLVAPFDYTYLPLAALMAYIVWDEVPRQTTLIGMGLIAASGLYLGYRELRSNRAHIDPLPVAEATVAPGNPTAPISLHADIDEH